MHPMFHQQTKHMETLCQNASRISINSRKQSHHRDKFEDDSMVHKTVNFRTWTVNSKRLQRSTITVFGRCIWQNFHAWCWTCFILSTYFYQAGEWQVNQTNLQAQQLYIQHPSNLSYSLQSQVKTLKSSAVETCRQQCTMHTKPVQRIKYTQTHTVCTHNHVSVGTEQAVFTCQHTQHNKWMTLQIELLGRVSPTSIKLEPSSNLTLTSV